MVKDGRFGAYVTDGEYNATLRKDDTVEAITLERAAELLAESASDGPGQEDGEEGREEGAREEDGRQEGDGEEDAAKKTTAKKTTAKKTAAKKLTRAAQARPRGTAAATGLPAVVPRAPARKCGQPPRRCASSPRAGVFSDTGVFVCFEGGEGAGKSTQSRAARATGWRPRATPSCSPSSPATPRSARSCAGSCSTRRPASCRDRTEALLYAADKAEHVDTRRAARRSTGARSSSPTATSTRRWPTRAPAATCATSPRSSGSRAGPPHGLRPHLTVLLDLEPELGLGRFDRRDRIEAESLEFHQRVREAFLDLAAADPDHYLVLDARAARRRDRAASGRRGRCVQAPGRPRSSTGSAT